MAEAPDPRRNARAKARDAEAAAPTVLTFGFGEHRWALRSSMVSPRDVADMKKAVHHDLTVLFKRLKDDTLEIDHAAGLVFLARRQATPTISFDEATAGMSLESEIHIGTGLVSDFPPR